jgi:hypothetical protein
MYPSLKKMWLPGLATGVAAFALMGGIVAVGMRPWWILLYHLPIPVVGSEWYILVPWSMVLPLAGATGAYLSRRAGGSAWQRFLASQLPVIVVLAIALVGFVIEVFQPRFGGFTVVLRKASIGVLEWVVLPGASMLLGAAPFLSDEQQQEVEHA